MFLARLGATQDPIGARTARSGRYVMEVFPALALPAMVPAIWHRKRGAKYNPATSKFDLLDWRIVASGVAGFARTLGGGPLAEWLMGESGRARPRKADQDRLDAAICLVIAWAWRHGPAECLAQIGDTRLGLLATIVSAETRAVLATAAAERAADFISPDAPKELT